MAKQRVTNSPYSSNDDYDVKKITTPDGDLQEVSVSSALTVRVDTDATYKYVGWALPGTSESSADWRIARWKIANVQALLWADGDSEFDNVWSDRATLIYV